MNSGNQQPQQPVQNRVKTLPQTQPYIGNTGLQGMDVIKNDASMRQDQIFNNVVQKYTGGGMAQ